MDARTALRRSAFAVARGRGFARLLTALERRARPHPDVLAVLTYHRVDDPARSQALYPGLISADPAQFEEQVRFLASRFRALSLAELLDVRRGVSRLPLRSLLVTFDDAYRDFGETAWPILKRHGVPVTLFVPTAYPGEPSRSFWWDRLYVALSATDRTDRLATPAGELPLGTESERMQAFRRLRRLLKSRPHEEAMALVDQLCEELSAPAPAPAVLTWSELRELHSEGVALAPHSRTHPLLDRVPSDVARSEIAGSLADLEREIGPVDRVFAYPAGGESEAVRGVLAELGFELAFVTSRGTNDLRRSDWLRLRRINVGHASGLPLLRAQLLPWWSRAYLRGEGGSRVTKRMQLLGPSSKWYKSRAGSGVGYCGFGPSRRQNFGKRRNP